MKQRFKAGVYTNPGQFREKNQDNFLLNKKYLPVDHKSKAAKVNGNVNGPYIFAVCDGMGGSSHGELASFIAVSTLKEGFISEIKSATKERRVYEIQSMIHQMNLNVSDLAEERGEKLGSTVALLYFDEMQLIISNIGDSRIYQLYNGKLNQLTKDHNQAFFMYESGIITKEEMKNHRGRHKLTQYLGVPPSEMIIDPYIYQMKHLSGKVTYLLCSDGLVESLEDEDLQLILEQEISVKKKAKQLVDDAINHKSKDNITALVVELMA